MSARTGETLGAPLSLASFLPRESFTSHRITLVHYVFVTLTNVPGARLAATFEDFCRWRVNSFQPFFQSDSIEVLD